MEYFNNIDIGNLILCSVVLHPDISKSKQQLESLSTTDVKSCLVYTDALGDTSLYPGTFVDSDEPPNTGN